MKEADYMQGRCNFQAISNQVSVLNLDPNHHYLVLSAYSGAFLWFYIYSYRTVASTNARY